MTRIYLVLTALIFVWGFSQIAFGNTMPVEPSHGACETYEEGCYRDNDHNGRPDNEDNVDSVNDDPYTRDDGSSNEGDYGDLYH